MIIIGILVVLLYVCLIIYINNKKKNLDKSKYDMVTTGVVFVNVFGYILAVICILMMIGGIIALVISNNKIAFWSLLGFSLFFYVLCFILLIDNNFSYEAIKDDEFIVYRFMKEKRIKIRDVKVIRINGPQVFFVRANGLNFCMADVNTPFLGEIIAYMQSNYNIESIQGNVINAVKETELDYDDKKVQIYKKIGKEYKDKLIKNENKNKIISIILLIVLCLISIFISILIDIIILGIVLIVMFIVFYNVMNKNRKKELEETYYNLGCKYYFKHKFVVGHGKTTFSRIRLVSIIYLILGLLFSLILLIPDHKRVDYNTLVEVSGQVEYCFEYSGENKKIVFGLVGDNTEYKLRSIFVDDFDFSFFDEVKINDYVIFYIDETNYEELNNNDYGKTRETEVYFVEANNKQYFNEENYIKGLTDDDRIKYIMGFIGVSVAVVSVITLIGGYVYYKNNSKKEYINAFE